MIAIIIAEDGLHFRVLRNDDVTGDVVEITEQYEIHPMAIQVGDKEVVGFHIGLTKATQTT